jgi:general nucleoside transport system permease protein
MKARLIQVAYAGRSIWAVLTALLCASVLFVIAGADPIQAYVTLFGEAFFDYFGFGATVVKFSPILLAGLAVALPLKAGLFNVGGEGQIYMGALFCTIAALFLPFLHPAIHLPLCIAAGALGGAFWAFIAGWLKAYRGINEVIVTLLLNYVGINLVSYAAGGPLMEEGAPYPYSPEVPTALHLPYILPPTDAHAGAPAGLVLALCLALLMRYTTFGFAMTIVGNNAQAARYAGISVEHQILYAMSLGGALAGLAGAFEILGLKYRLFHMFSAGYGFDGIVVAFIASANLAFLPIAALFLAGLRAGAQLMQRAVGVDSTIVDAIQGLVVMFVAASLALRFSDSRWGRAAAQRRADEALAGSKELKHG